jgi:uncharacterized protein
MVVFESERVRRLIGRLERGERLPDALVTLAGDHGVGAAWVRGLGAFEWVELCEYDQGEQRYRAPQRIDGACELLALTGNVSIKDGEPFAHVHVTVSREVGGDVQVMGGHLVAAGVFACELSLECYDDLSLVRVADRATGLALWDDRPEARPDSEPPGAVSWAQVAAASEVPVAPPPPRGRRRPGRLSGEKLPPVPSPEPLPSRRRTTEEEFLRELHPERGDYIEHRQFGTCRVEGEDAHGGLRIRLPSGVRKVIRLEMLQVREPRQEEGRRVFPVRPRTGR